MKNKFNFEIFDLKENKFIDYEFEIQDIDPFIFQDEKIKLGVNANTKNYCTKLLSEMVVKPDFFADIKSWKDDFYGLDEFVEMLSQYHTDLRARPTTRKGFREIKQK